MYDRSDKESQKTQNIDVLNDDARTYTPRTACWNARTRRQKSLLSESVYFCFIKPLKYIDPNGTVIIDINLVCRVDDGKDAEYSMLNIFGKSIESQNNDR